jgi:dihydrofolate reductase
MPKVLNLIVACAENRVIGRDGKLPWRIPEDLNFFHAETAGQICVLGRVCYDSWPRVRLDGRKPVVLTSRPLAHARGNTRHEGGAQENVPNRDEPGSHELGRVESDPIAVRSLPEALAVAEDLPGEIYICGGERVYAETLALSRPMRLHLTLIHASIPGDTYFPEWRHLAWREVARRESSDQNYRYTFYTLELFAPQKS